ncbi:class I SAM-dependent methyltransferase [Nonomuraea sp. NPDC050022]|uniref:class I SAM-dependent methyltransferase n=1 Tax=Nonomuraea sp. NPDC050022 TaxID=3364358 RepID=UPI0037A11DD2
MSHTEPASVANPEQAKAWNEGDGRHWVAHRDRYDEMMKRISSHLFEAAAIAPEDHVLDIGCGSGQTTCTAARGAHEGQALGIDLSAPLLEEARRRAQGENLVNTRFEQADAQVHPFAAASVDVVISRFGVMFFNDPVTAFTNIARATRPDGRLAFLCWRKPLDNEWITELGAVLASYVPLSGSFDNDGPGPFSLAASSRITDLLHTVGYTQISVDPVDEPMRLGDDVNDVLDFVSQMGPVSSLLDKADEETRAKMLGALHERLGSHETAAGVFLRSAAWLVTARRPG